MDAERGRLNVAPYPTDTVSVIQCCPASFTASMIIINYLTNPRVTENWFVKFLLV